MPAALPRPLEGIVPPLVTPLADRETLDCEGLGRMVEHLLAGGVSGLFILGTTGEGPSLSYRLRQQVIDEASERVRGRAPLLVGITDSSFAESLELAGYAADAGAAALVLAAPYYYPAGQADLADYVERLVQRLPLPLFLYNMPSHTKLAFEPATVRRLMDLPGVVGLKDSSANMIYFHTLRQLAGNRPDWTLLVGPEELLAESVLLGGHGGVCGGANLFPRLYVELFHAARSGDLPRARALHEEVIRIAAALYTIGRPGASVTAGLKCALALQGICGDEMAEPFSRLDEAQQSLVRQHLERFAPRWFEPAAAPVRR